VTTIGGRQTQMRATVIQPVITSYGFEEASADSTAGSAHPYEKFSDGSSIVPNIEQIETGPILDVVPSVLSDGYTIRLRTIASLIDFLGYASSKGLAPEYATNADGVRIKLPTTVPVCDVREASTEKLLYDRQTLVLFPEQELPSMRDEKARERVAEYIRKVGKSDKTLLTLVTITLIDAAGNPVHTDDELPFAQNGVPPQSP
jgi:hypothetical protein